MMLFIGILLYIFTVVNGNVINVPENITRNARFVGDGSFPVTLNLKDVLVSINIMQMQKGEMLKVQPIPDNFGLFSYNASQPFANVEESDDDCDPEDCNKNTDTNSVLNLFKGALLPNKVNQDESDELRDEADVNFVLGKTFNLYSAPGLATTKDESAPSYWKYIDQSQWSVRFPVCGGVRQSPIDLPANPMSVTGASCLNWANYHSQQRYLTLNNDGHTVIASSTWASGGLPILSGGVLQGTYRLAGIHWHWGRDSNDGSEHSFQSRKYPLEMHLVHFNTQYATIDDALASGNPEALAVVGVLFRSSVFSNYGMTLITRAMKRATGTGTQDTVLPLGHLGLNFRDGYYTYQGSLTIPPCNQVVRWIVLRKVLHIRESHLKVFRSVLVNGKPLVDIYRHVQPLNGRLIQFYERCN